MGAESRTPAPAQTEGWGARLPVPARMARRDNSSSVEAPADHHPIVHAPIVHDQERVVELALGGIVSRRSRASAVVAEHPTGIKTGASERPPTDGERTGTTASASGARSVAGEAVSSKAVETGRPGGGAGERWRATRSGGKLSPRPAGSSGRPRARRWWEAMTPCLAPCSTATHVRLALAPERSRRRDGESDAPIGRAGGGPLQGADQESRLQGPEAQVPWLCSGGRLVAPQSAAHAPGLHAGVQVHPPGADGELRVTSSLPACCRGTSSRVP